MVWAGNTSGSHLVWTGVVIGPASDHKELSGAAGHGRRADRLLHRSHLRPAVGEGVVALNATEAALAVVSAHCVHLRAATHVTHSVAGKANCGLKVSTPEKMLMIKRISWWPCTSVSTLAFKKPVFRVRTMMYFLASTIISGFVCLFQATTTLKPYTAAPLSDLKNFRLHDLCVPHTYYTTVLLL